MTTNPPLLTAEHLQWSRVIQIFNERSPHCETCSFLELHRDSAPYGEGWATNVFETCSLGETRSHVPTMCPALRVLMEEEE
jgi:hypothetical protein